MRVKGMGIIKRGIAVGLIALMACTNPLQTLSPANGSAEQSDDLTGQPTVASAAEKAAPYVGEVRLAVDKKADKAKQILEDAGYEVIDQDLNEKTGSFWNDLGDQAVFMGIKRTADEKKAIRDMKTMNMLGKYSYSDLKTRIEESKSQASDIYWRLNLAIKEYAKNYKAGDIAATQAHDLLNLYREDDSGELVGDLFLGDYSEEDVFKIIMEGNVINVAAISKDLAYGAEKASANGDTWLERLSKVTSYNAVVKEYVKGMFGTENPTDEQKEKAEKAVQSDLYYSAAELLDKWGDVRKIFTDEEANEQDVKDFLDDEGEDISVVEYAEKLSDVTAAVYSKSVKYGKKTLYDLFTLPASTFEKNIKNLYPLVFALSEGQRAILRFVDISDYFQASFMRIGARENEKEVKEKQDEANKQILSETEVISVYEGVDRDQFSDNAAMTSMATANMSAGNVDDSDKNGSAVNFFKAHALLFAIAGAAGIAGSTYLLVKAKNDLADFLNTYNISDLTVEEADDYTNLSNNIKMAKILIGVSAILTVVSAIQFYRTKKSEFNHEQLPIPEVLVDYDTENEAGRNVTYHAVKWNRTREAKGKEKASDRADRADLNGDAAREWLALYTTTDTAMGEPILADSIITKVGDNNAPTDTKTGAYVPLTMFGLKTVQNLVDEQYSYYDEVGGIYLWYKKAADGSSATDELIDDTEEEETPEDAEAEAGEETDQQEEDADAASGAAAETTGSNIGNGSIVLFVTMGAVGGFIIGMICMYYIRRKKVVTKENE